MNRRVSARYSVGRLRGVFYGWRLVGIAAFMLTLMSLTVFRGVGIMLVALERQFAWSRTALSERVLAGARRGRGSGTYRRRPRGQDRHAAHGSHRIHSDGARLHLARAHRAARRLGAAFVARLHPALPAVHRARPDAAPLLHIVHRHHARLRAWRLAGARGDDQQLVQPQALDSDGGVHVGHTRGGDADTGVRAADRALRAGFGGAGDRGCFCWR